jgi:hypothetical protein
VSNRSHGPVSQRTCLFDGNAHHAYDVRRAVLAPLLLIIVGGVAWWFMAPGQQFLPAFARLLTLPTIKRGPLSLLSGRSYATGQFKGRDVAIRLQLRRGRYQLGYLVVAVRTGGPETLDSSGVELRVRDDAGKRALFTIAAQDLLLTVEDGWLKTMWKPIGFTIFPGRFAEEKWRPVLDAMQIVATSLESAG